MNQPKYKAALFVISSLIVATIFYLIIWHDAGDVSNQQVEKGLLDFSDSAFNSQKIKKLEGECEFYYNKLLSPTDFKKKEQPTLDGYIKIPGIWNDFELNGKKLPGEGYATYRLKIKVKEDGRYGIKIKEFDCAYKIWANLDSTSSGQVGKNKESEIPCWQRKEIYCTSINKEIDVIIQLSNFHHRKGGPEDSMLFGTAEAIIKTKHRQLITDVLFLGILLAMAGYHFVLFLYRRKDKSIIYFSLITFVIALRILTSGEKILIDLFPTINWDLAVRIEYISYQLSVPLFAAFLNTLFPKEFKPGLVKVATINAALTILIVLFTPVSVFSYTTITYNIFITGIATLAVVLFIIAIARQREHSFVLFLGYMSFFIVVLNDLLYAVRYLDTSYWLPLGMLAMILSQAFAISKRTSKAFSMVEHLSASLNRHNKELQEKVKERTLKLEEYTNKLKLLNHDLSNEVKLKNESLEALRISEQKLQESNTTKDKFFSLIAHDLKGPIGNLAVIFNRFKPEMINREMYDNIKISTQNTYNLLTDLLTWARNQNKQIEFYPTDINVNELLGKIKNILDISAQNKNIRINIINEQEKLFAYADYDSVYTVIRNLTSNAIKFTHAGGNINLSAYKENRQIKIVVEDNGVGIPDAKLKTLFNPGQNKISTRGTNNERGSGLGLIICRDFITANCGEIGAKSQSGIGSTFWFTLPLGLSGLHKNLISEIKNAHLKVLVVEDNPLNLQTTRSVLDELGISYEIATTGEEGLKKGLNNWYDIIFMDIELPTKNGIFINKEIRKKYPKAKIFALSSYDKDEIEARDKTVFFNAYLKKPLEPEALINHLKTIELPKEKNLA